MWVTSAVQHHFFMVSKDGDMLAVVTQLKQELKHLPALWSPIDIVPQGDNCVR